MFPQSTQPDRPKIRFDLRFFLTEAEWLEATHVLHPISSKPAARILGRLINAVLAVALLLLPHTLGRSWTEIFRFSPLGTIPPLLMFCLCAWNASGIGMKAINHRLNRLDLERHIVLTDRGADVTQGEYVRNYQWNDFTYFRETPALFVLRTSGTKFWTIPRRVLNSADAESFRQFLCQKLPRRQPWSWSPDTSGVAH